MFAFFKKAVTKRASAAELRAQNSLAAKTGIAAIEPFYEVARLLSDNDREVMQEMQFAGGRAASEYFAARKEQFAQRGIQTMTQLAACDNGEIWLLGLVDVLIKLEYACELDWKEEIEEFAAAARRLFEVRANGLPVEAFGLFDDDDPEEWRKRLNAAWQPLDFYLANIGIDGDSYVLVPCRLRHLTLLQAKARECGFPID